MWVERQEFNLAFILFDYILLLDYNNDKGSKERRIIVKIKRVKKVEKNNEEEKQKRSRRGKNAKVKGASFERDIAKKFQKRYGVELKRTPQSGGFAKKSSKADDFRGDITLVDNLLDFLLHVECKNQKTWSLHQWIKQAENDCPENKIPIVVFHEYNTSNDYVSLKLEDLFHLVEYTKIFKEK